MNSPTFLKLHQQLRRAMGSGCGGTGVGAPPASKHVLGNHADYPHRPPKIPRCEEGDPHDDGVGEEEVDELGLLEDKKVTNTKPGTQRYLIAVEYVGTRFFGSQKQPNCRTVVGALEEAFKKFVGQPVSVCCSSRTDARVHALSNVFHVDVERTSKRKPGEVLPPHEPAIVKNAVNHFLQKDDPDAMVIDVRFVPSDFHARYKALERTYHYRLLCGPEPLPVFEKDRAWHIPEELNIEAMQEACKVLVGCHDFSSFRASGCQAKSPVRLLDELRVSESVSMLHIPSSIGSDRMSTSGDKFSTSYEDPNAGSATSISNGSSLPFGIRKAHRCLVITARSRSFLYHQVRLLVGALKCVGTGELTVSDVKRILDAKNVTAAKPMAPSSGLYLGNVRYDLPCPEP